MICFSMLWSPCVKTGDDHELFMIAAAQHKVITGKKQYQNMELFAIDIFWRDHGYLILLINSGYYELGN